MRTDAFLRAKTLVRASNLPVNGQGVNAVSSIVLMLKRILLK